MDSVETSEKSALYDIESMYTAPGEIFINCQLCMRRHVKQYKHKCVECGRHFCHVCGPEIRYQFMRCALCTYPKHYFCWIRRRLVDDSEFVVYAITNAVCKNCFTGPDGK